MCCGHNVFKNEDLYSYSKESKHNKVLEQVKNSIFSKYIGYHDILMYYTKTLNVMRCKIHDSLVLEVIVTAQNSNIVLLIKLKQSVLYHNIT